MVARTYDTDLTKGAPWKMIVRFAIPIFLSQTFQQLYNSVDSLIVGNFLGKDALAAVSSSGNLIFLLVSFFTGVAGGAGIVISRYYGAGDYEKLQRAVHTKIALGLCSGAVLTVAGVLLTPTLLRWMGTDPQVLPQSITYFRFYFCGVLANVMYNICTGILNAVGDSRRPLYYLIFSSVLNVLLDLLFVAVFHFGVGSAALATVIAQGCSFLLCLRTLLKKGTVYRVEPKKIRFHGDVLREILRYGLPTGVQNSVIGFANVLVQTNINTFGANAMAGCGSYFKVEGFAFLPITCFSMGLATFISQNLGAKKYDRARTGARFGLIISPLLAECVGLVIFFAAPVLIGLFNREPEVVAFGVKQCHTEALFYFLLAFAHCVAGICRGAGKAIVPMIIMLSIWCVLRIVYITVAMHLCHNIILLFCAYPLTWGISSIIYLIYYKKSDWIHGFEAKQKKTRATA